MATSFDFSGLTMLEQHIAALQTAQAATPSLFTGGATFTATYSNVPLAVSQAQSGPTTESINSISQRVAAIKANLDRLPR